MRKRTGFGETKELDEIYKARERPEIYDSCKDLRRGDSLAADLPLSPEGRFRDAALFIMSAKMWTLFTHG